MHQLQCQTSQPHFRAGSSPEKTSVARLGQEKAYNFRIVHARDILTVFFKKSVTSVGDAMLCPPSFLLGLFMGGPPPRSTNRSGEVHGVRAATVRTASATMVLGAPISPRPVSSIPGSVLQVGFCEVLRQRVPIRENRASGWKYGWKLKNGRTERDSIFTISL